jgi:uncharacterized protein
MSHETPTIGRRAFLGSAVAAGATLALGPSFWKSAFALPAQPGPNPFGELLPPDANGIMLPPGFTSRVIARTGSPVPGTTYVWPTAPDGQATFPTADGGWILVTNSEWASNTLLGILAPVLGPAANPALAAGVSALRFDRDGVIQDAYRILGGTDINCAGGPTPWGTWLSGEEFDFTPFTADQLAASRDFRALGPLAVPAAQYLAQRGGLLWECDPSKAGQGTPLPALGVFQHEAAAVHPSNSFVYMTEDQQDGLLYRFRPRRPVNAKRGARPDLTQGTLEVAQILETDAVLHGESPVVWHRVPDPTVENGIPTRQQVPQATIFRRGEGMWFDSDTIYFTTTADNRVWAYLPDSETITVIYDAASTPDGPLRGADNITVHPATGDLFVAEDGGNMEVVLITSPLDRQRRVATPFLRMEPAAGVPQVGTEVTGPCFDPSGTRMYVSSQRGIATSTFPLPQRGITYEITGPFPRNLTRPGRPPSGRPR